MGDFKSIDPEFRPLRNVAVITLDIDQIKDTHDIKSETSDKVQTGLLKSINAYFSEFMNNSTIHGFKYIVGTDRTYAEKIWWMFVLSVSIYTCAILIGLTWKKWEDSPVLISSRQDPVRIWEIPFPAITLCSSYHFSRNSGYNFVSYDLKNGSRESENASSYCSSQSDRFYEYQNITKDPEMTDFILQTALAREDILRGCLYNRNFDPTDCSPLFSPILTGLGLCFTFNMLDRNDLFTSVMYLSDGLAHQQNMSHWTVDKNYDNTSETGFPVRVSTQYGFLSILLNGAISDIGCRGDSDFTVILHHPGSTPAVPSRFFNMNNMVNRYEIWIRPAITTTSDDLKYYPPHRRKCFYSDERPLKFFKIYTLENCKTECLANRTLKRCGCVPYYMPHEVTETLCTLTSNCAISLSDFVESEVGITGDSISQYCGCLPSCTSITYNIDVDKMTIYKFDPMVQVSIQFRDPEFIAMERQELFGDVNFWANCGGLLGLFTGFSVLSLAEMIYYLSLRWICKLKRRFCYRMKTIV